MINKNLLLIVAIFIISQARSMDGVPHVRIDMTDKNCDVDAVLARVAAQIAATDTTDIDLEEILAEELLIIGSDVTTSLSELEAPDAAALQSALATAMGAIGEVREPRLAGLAETDLNAVLAIAKADYEKTLRQAMKRPVWRDASYNGQTTLRLGDYLNRANAETKRRCIEYFAVSITSRQSFMHFFTTPSEVRTQMACAASSIVDTAAIEKYSSAAKAANVLLAHEGGEIMHRLLLEHFGLPAPLGPIDYAQLITKTKQTLAELSQQYPGW